MNNTIPSKEERILNAVKFVLVSIVKETATAPGMKHPLSDATLTDIRQCLNLISEREREFSAARGQESGLRPVTPDQRKPAATSNETVVTIDAIGRPKKS